MYMAPACFAWLLLGSIVLEGRLIIAEGGLQLIAAKPLLYLTAAALGFAVNALAYVVIQTGSSLTLKVLGTVKNAVVVWLGILMFAEVVTPLQVNICSILMLSPPHR